MEYNLVNYYVLEAYDNAPFLPPPVLKSLHT